MSKLKPGSSLNNVFHAYGIIDAGKLDQDLIVAEAVLLNGGFAHTQRINSTPNCLNRLSHGPLFYVVDGGGLEDHIVRTFSPSDQIVVAQIIRDSGAQVAALVRRNPFDRD